ncbi:MAG: serine protease [Spirochaetes bacterium]|nr:MAG: serine protease [Spirochaetota bacterium]
MSGNKYISKILKPAVLTALVLLLSVLFSSCTTSPPADTHLSDIEVLKAVQNSFNRVAEKVLPVVVEINVEEIVKQKLPEGNLPWNFFFGTPPSDNKPKEKEYKKYGLGSGVIVRRIGSKVYVLTNNHVVGDAQKIEIKLYDMRKFKANLVGKDSRKDLALVAFNTDEKVPIAKLGDSSKLKIGDWVFAVGNPLGFESTVTAGIVSGLGRHGGPDGNISDFIQTDAAINQGNSGGALTDIDGNVVGINTWITSPTGGSIGLGFAIPINNAKREINDLIKKGKVNYGWLGVNIGDPILSVAKDLKVENIKGALVYNVFKGSPADKGGILPGDYITEINKTAIEKFTQLVVLIGNLPPGKIAHFAIIRNGSLIHLDVKITVRKEEAKVIALKKNLWPGFSIAKINNDVRDKLNLSNKASGLIIVRVESGTPAAIAGLKQLDIIKSINDKEVKGLLDFYKELNKKSAGSINFKLIRNGKERTISLAR